MKKLVDSYDFDNREEALLGVWDKHNASSTAKDEPDAEFEARLVAAYRKAEEATLRVTEAEEEAICRRMAADASLDDDTPESRNDAKPPSPASITSAKAARAARGLSSYHFRLAAIVLASSAFGALLVMLTMWQRSHDASEMVFVAEEYARRGVMPGLNSAEAYSSKNASRTDSEIELMESKLDDACNDRDLFTHGRARSSSSLCIRSPTGADSQMSPSRNAASVRGMKNRSPASPPADAARAPQTSPGSTKEAGSTPGVMLAGKSSETRVGSESAPSLSFRLSGERSQTATRLDDVTETIVVTGSAGRILPWSAQDARNMPKKVPAKQLAEWATPNDSARHYDQDSYAKAEALYVRALTDHEEKFGPNHPAIATDLNNLAMLYQAQGAYAKTEPLHLRALAIREKALGPNHPDVAESLKNLAMLYEAQGSYVKAEPLYVRALDILEKALGPNHPHVATSLRDLAMLYEAQGAYAKAEPLYVRALAIREKALGPNHPDVAESLKNLAMLYEAQGLYVKAEPLYVRALDILEKALGRSHPNVATNLGNLAGCYWAQGAYVKAEALMARAADIEEQQLRTDFVRLPEQRKRALMTLIQRNTDRLVSFHVDATPGSTSVRDLALTTVLRRNGRVLDYLVDSESRIRRSLTPYLRDQLDQLFLARADLAANLYAPAGRGSIANRAAADAARVKIDRLESVLSATSAEFRAETESVTVAKVRTQLPNDAVLVEFAKYRRFDPRRLRSSQPQEERYIAYLLTANDPAQWVALGEAAPIDAQVDIVLAAIRDNSPTEATRAALQRLDALVLAPIRTKLPGISHLILAPDSQLNLVPFEALVDAQGHYALENYLISYVTTGRDLLRIAAPRAPRSPAVILADPDYGPTPSPGPGTMPLTPLPDAQAEAADLQPYFLAAPITGANATKAALASLTAPAIIHIATHGFYARDAPSGRPPPGVLRDVARGFYLEDDASSQATSSRSDDLADGLDRAGLALAGANQGPDGIVTAREIAGFDWWGTQLVVLSACETGVGATSSGDGVYGLRRALVLAGAASQVVSLWNVEDASTRQLMSEFYGNLARGVGRAEALRQAKLSLLHQPGYEHPFYWAPFIAAGDWRPLPKGILLPRKSAP